MQLIGVDCQVPSNKIGNEDIIELVKYHSSRYFNGDLGLLEILIRRFLRLTGINSRFWRNEQERPIDLLEISMNRALRMAGISKNEIGMVIYSGIDRGFIEPSNASVLCNELDIHNVRSFDIVDACMGWNSAVQTASSFFKAEQSLEYILLLNAEFPMDKKGTILPENFTIRTNKEMDWKSPSFTIGEGASSCVFKRNDNLSPRYHFREEPGFATLCSIPLMNFEKYLELNKNLQQTEMQFYADGAALLENGIQSSCDILTQLLDSIDYMPSIVFPHSVSERVIQQAFQAIKTDLKICSTFSDLGNLATVSIPSAIAKAVLNGEAKKGDKTVAWVASAGMKFSAIEVLL